MRFPISNRVFWAGVVLSCALILSGRVTGQEASKTESPTTPSTSPSNNTKIGRFTEGKGTLIYQDRKELITVRGRGLTYVTATAVSSFVPGREKERIGGIVLGIFNPDDKRFYTAYIDVEEAENLASALIMMASQAESIKGRDVGEKRFRFTGTDFYTFIVYHGVEDKKVVQSFEVTSDLAFPVRATLKGADGYQALAGALQSGIIWIKQQ